VSVIVPTRDSETTLERCLASIRSQTVPPHELIVVDNWSEDGTVEVARRHADLVLACGPERSAQRNRAATHATGEALVFIDSDMVLEDCLVEEITKRFAERVTEAAYVIPEFVIGDGFWVRCRALEKQLYVGDLTVEAARVFRRTVFEELGGYDESLTAAEDWDLSDRLVRAGYPIAHTHSRVWHDESGLTLRLAFKKKRYYGRTIGQYAGKSARSLARRLSRTALVRQPRGLVRAPALTLGLFVLKSIEALGLMIGLVDRRWKPGKPSPSDDCVILSRQENR